MPLSGKVPIQEEQRLKAYLYGPPDGGKTLAALQFSNSYIIDTAKETTRYYKLVQMKNNEVFHCSDFFKVKKELEILRDEPHRFQTLIIDEISTLYQKLQRYWTDRFVKALENKKAKNKVSNDENLLEDFGYRYWDKVKRDWKDFIDTIRQLDMNVIVTAHQKNKYGTGTQIIGVTSDSDKDDEHVWDFVFHIIKRGLDHRALTEKQRVLPLKIDPEAVRFPEEFEWDYANLIKFYNREYIERPTKNSLMLKNNSTNNYTPTLGATPITDNTAALQTKITKDNESVKHTETTVNPTNSSAPENVEIINKIKLLLKNERIKIKDFKVFLQNICKWKDATALSNLTPKHQSSILNNWEKKVLPKYRESLKGKTEVAPPNNNTETKEGEPENTISPEKEVFDPNGTIRPSQQLELIKLLKGKNITPERFLSGFDLKGWYEITQEGAGNMIKNFELTIGALQ